MKSFLILLIVGLSHFAQAKTLQIDSLKAADLSAALIDSGSKPSCDDTTCVISIAKATCVVASIGPANVSCSAALENSSGEMIMTPLSNSTSVTLVNAMQAVHGFTPECTPAGCRLTVISVDCQYPADEKIFARGVGSTCNIVQANSVAQ